jgi:hypothetical protein
MSNDIYIKLQPHRNVQKAVIGYLDMQQKSGQLDKRLF